GTAGRPVLCGSAPTPPGPVVGGLAVSAVTAPLLTVTLAGSPLPPWCFPGCQLNPAMMTITPPMPSASASRRRKRRRLSRWRAQRPGASSLSGAMVVASLTAFIGFSLHSLGGTVGDGDRGMATLWHRPPARTGTCLRLMDAAVLSVMTPRPSPESGETPAKAAARHLNGRGAGRRWAGSAGPYARRRVRGSARAVAPGHHRLRAVPRRRPAEAGRPLAGHDRVDLPLGRRRRAGPRRRGPRRTAGAGPAVAGAPAGAPAPPAPVPEALGTSRPVPPDGTAALTAPERCPEMGPDGCRLAWLPADHGRGPPQLGGLRHPRARDAGRARRRRRRPPADGRAPPPHRHRTGRPARWHRLRLGGGRRRRPG